MVFGLCQEYVGVCVKNMLILNKDLVNIQGSKRMMSRYPKNVSAKVWDTRKGIYSWPNLEN